MSTDEDFDDKAARAGSPRSGSSTTPPSPGSGCAAGTPTAGSAGGRSPWSCAARASPTASPRRRWPRSTRVGRPPGPRTDRPQAALDGRRHRGPARDRRAGGWSGCSPARATAPAPPTGSSAKPSPSGAPTPTSSGPVRTSTADLPEHHSTARARTCTSPTQAAHLGELAEELEQRLAERLHRLARRQVRASGERDRPVQRWIQRRAAQPGPAREHQIRHHRHPGARLHQAQHGVHLPALHGEPRGHARVGVGLQGHLAQVVAAPRHDQRAAGQFLDRHRATARRRLLRRGRRHRQPFPQHRREVQPGVESFGRHDHQGDVDLVAQQRADQQLRPVLGQLQMDRRVPVVEDAHHVGQHADAQRRGGPHSHPPALQPDQLRYRHPGGLHVGEHPPSQRQHRVAGRREGDSAAGAVHQGCAQFVFQHFQLPTESRLGHPQ